jgi:hypothetical protein
VLCLQLLVNDNLDLGCTIIERAATDKAVRDIDKSLAQAYEVGGAAMMRLHIVLPYCTAYSPCFTVYSTAIFFCHILLPPCIALLYCRPHAIAPGLLRLFRLAWLPASVEWTSTSAPCCSSRQQGLSLLRCLTASSQSRATLRSSVFMRTMADCPGGCTPCQGATLELREQHPPAAHCRSGKGMLHKNMLHRQTEDRKAGRQAWMDGWM